MSNTNSTHAKVRLLAAVAFLIPACAANSNSSDPAAESTGTGAAASTGAATETSTVSDAGSTAGPPAVSTTGETAATSEGTAAGTTTDDAGSSGTTAAGDGHSSDAGSTSDATTGNAPFVGFEACDPPESTCEHPGEICVAEAFDTNFCTIPCTSDDDCPAPPPGGTTAPVCDHSDLEGQCTLPCASDDVCPAGMVCVGYCVWVDPWTCAPGLYGDGVCDCGCGKWDSDCEDISNDLCERCNAAGSCAGSCDDISLFDNTQCAPVPGWSLCHPGFYGDSVCNCGCGASDIDCADASAASCVQCISGCSGLSGSCEYIDPVDNSQCDTEAWTCDPLLYDDGAICNCGCGQFDPDCGNYLAPVEACDSCEDAGSCAEGLGCAAVTFFPHTGLCI